MNEERLPPLHPGEVLLEDFLKPMGISQYRLAKALGVPVQRIHDLAGDCWIPSGAVRYRRCSIEGGSPAGRLTLDDRISYHLGPLALYEVHESLDRRALGPVAGEEACGVMEAKHGGGALPEWCRRLVGDRASAEYSKFLMLSRLSCAVNNYVD